MVVCLIQPQMRVFAQIQIFSLSNVINPDPRMVLCVTCGFQGKKNKHISHANLLTAEQNVILSAPDRSRFALQNPRDHYRTLNVTLLKNVPALGLPALVVSLGKIAQPLHVTWRIKKG